MQLRDNYIRARHHVNYGSTKPILSNKLLNNEAWNGPCHAVNLKIANNLGLCQRLANLPASGNNVSRKL